MFKKLVDAIDQQAWLDSLGDAIQQSIGKAFQSSGRIGKETQNLLNGTWLGHALHPALSDVPIGAWTTSIFLDMVENGDHSLAKASDRAILLGLLASVPASLSGLTDWQHLIDKPKRVGLMHGLLNLSSTALYSLSLVLRSQGHRGAGKLLSTLGYATVIASSYLGGELVMEYHSGVNWVGTLEEPKDFKPVIEESKLEDNNPVCVTVDSVPLMLVRWQGNIYALANTCPHLGGPLCEGEFDSGIITCPWHGSKFDVTDGSIIDGPTAYPAKRFQTRINNGQVEVRLAES